MPTLKLKQAVNQGIIPGPRVLAIDASDCGYRQLCSQRLCAGMACAAGAEEADGVDSLIRVVRDQIGHGADWDQAVRRLSLGAPSGVESDVFARGDEARGRDCEERGSAGGGSYQHRGRDAARNSRGCGNHRHGNEGTAETWKLMVEHHVALCPTLAAGDATAQYSGWKKGQPEPQGLVRKRASFKAALDAGVTILSGSDVGVFPHGDNAREIELMVDYGMPTLEALKSATSIAGRVLHMDIGLVKQGMLADLIAVDGNPVSDISAISEGEIRHEGRDGAKVVIEKLENC